MSHDEITAAEFKKIKDQDNVFLLDVREPHEYEACNMGGYLIPLGELPARLDEIPDCQIVVHCKGGGRSRKAMEFLKQSGFQNVLNLQGGILSWLEETAPDLIK